MTFQELGVAASLIDILEGEGIVVPTQIQAEVIPTAAKGESLVAISQTGSGKTLSYLLPALARLSNGGVKGMLVLAPTRELAQQIASVCDIIRGDVSYTTIYGGVEYAPQIAALATKPDIIISTPGRLIDLIEQNALLATSFDIFVLDEVDQMLDLGFRDAIARLAQLRSNASQLLCFSATSPQGVQSIIEELAPDINYITAQGQRVAVEKIEQRGYFVEQKMMDPLLIHVIRNEKPHRTILFSRSRKMADRLATLLTENGFNAEAMHSDRSQKAREYILERFKSGETQIIVATDIIARGIDIDDVTHVINYGLPQQAQQYIHRIGRTARSGRSGVAITLCIPDDRLLLDETCRMMKQHIVMSTDHPYQSYELTKALMVDYKNLPKSKPNKKKR